MLTLKARWYLLAACLSLPVALWAGDKAVQIFKTPVAIVLPYSVPVAFSTACFLRQDKELALAEQITSSLPKEKFTRDFSFSEVIALQRAMYAYRLNSAKEVLDIFEEVLSSRSQVIDPATFADWCLTQEKYILNGD